jgi:phosphoglucosamine mutase
VISASHNPMEFNGIKIFAGTGYKLPDEVENQIEAHIDSGCRDIPLATGAGVGHVSVRSDGIRDYVDYLYEAVGGDLSGLRVCIDCANGASAAVAQQLFPRLGANCTFLGVSPDGANINRGVGSTHLENLEKAVVDGGYDCGVAFDGDADRCLACDEKGEEIDGDKIIALLSMNMKAKNRLDGDTAVVTVMSNLGFMKFMEKQGIRTERTAVGDRYVLENMRENGYAIGGEQSGHVILLHHATTGDGELTAGKLLKMLAESGKRMSELNGVYKKFPQVLLNIEANPAQKAAYKEDEVIAGFIENEQQKLMGMGRVLVRVSGTEPKIRVMVEGEDTEAIAGCAQRIVDVINRRVIRS